MPIWNSCCTVGDLALLSQQLYFISILCLPECIATAHPLCMLKIWSVRVLGSGQPIYIKCRQHCWLFRCCMRLYRVHNLILCIFLDATIWLSEYSLYVTGVLFNNFTKFSGSSLTKDFFLDVFLCKILCTLNVWPLSGLHGSWF